MAILSEEFLSNYKNQEPPFGPIGYVVFKRTYARLIESENRTEEWWETCRREVEGIIGLGCKLTQKEAEELYDDCFNMRCSFSGRAKWQLGSKTVEKIGGASLNACWGVLIDNWKSFVFAFDMSMLGGGVGLNIQREYVYQLPTIRKNVTVLRQDTKDADFIVPDSREGWCDLLSKVLEAYFETGKSFSYSTICLRGKDVPIKGFGGISSGPEVLCNGLEDICKIFQKRQGKKLRPIDCLDIINIIGSIVVSGNVRRSAQLIIGDQDDRQFINAKRWDLGNVPNWRSNSNNSIVCNDINTLPDSFWDSFGINEQTGEAKGENYGLINLGLSRRKGRVLDCHRVDPNVSIFNPCAEISLAPVPNSGEGEACNLFEIFISRIPNKSEFIRIAKNAYKVTKTISSVKYHWPKTNKLIHKNMRLGISISGVCEWLSNIEREEASNWLDSCYKELEAEDRKYSKENGFKESIKLTTCKPSGTLSKLPHTSPGIHPFYAPYYIQRIRFASNDPLIPELKKCGYPTEYKQEFDGSIDRNTMIVSFPVKCPENSIFAKDMTAIEQLELVKFVNTYWSDNSTSVTVYYKNEELPEIKEWMKENYNQFIKSISFLLHSNHGFKQAPYEEISQEQFEELSRRIKPIRSIRDSGGSDIEEMECASGVCPIK